MINNNPQIVYNLPNNLIYLLKRFDTTQAELALYADVSQNSISNWINEVSYPNVLALIKIYQFFGVSIDSFVFEDLENSKVVTDQHVKDFKRISKDGRNVVGKIQPISKDYFTLNNDQLSIMNEPESTLTFAMMSQFKIMADKIDQVRVIAEDIKKNTVKK